MNAKKFKKTATFTLVMLVSLLLSLPAFSASRIKDIADFEGVRDNQLVGYGMVVGLNGTGDNIKSINFAKESLVSLLDSVGINSRDGQLKSKNIAAVMVTANLPAFARQESQAEHKHGSRNNRLFVNFNFQTLGQQRIFAMTAFDEKTDAKTYQGNGCGNKKHTAQAAKAAEINAQSRRKGH